MRTSDLATISDQDFALFQKLIATLTGIHLAPIKKTLLCGRLAKRLRDLEIGSYREYYALISSGRDDEERERCINLITTNETYFFREPKHFDYLRNQVLPHYRNKRFRLWSAACSSGEEVFTLALVLAEQFGVQSDWEILGSDISTNVLRRAARAVYPLERGENIPQSLLKKYCLKGVGDMAGSFMIDDSIRRHVRLAQINLNEALPDTGSFDVVFLRNVMIYFPNEVKAQVVERLAEKINPGGWLFIGHSETLNGVTNVMHQASPTVYRKRS